MMREPTPQPERSKSKEEQFLERSPYKELKEKLKEIIEKLENAGLTSDAEIVRRVFPRLEAWIKRVIKEKEDLERIHKRDYCRRYATREPLVSRFVCTGNSRDRQRRRLGIYARRRCWRMVWAGACT
jgi:hypothetical protein